jgi:HSP20 family protein
MLRKETRAVSFLNFCMTGPAQALSLASSPFYAPNHSPLFSKEKTMNALTRIEAFDQLLPEMFRRMASPMRLAEGTQGDIRLDVTEHASDYEVRAEIPGAKKEDIRVTVDGSFVSIAAEVKKESEEKSGARVLLKETYIGRVSRGFSLAHEVDTKGVIAKFEDGVLKLSLPKREGSGSRSIKVD